MKLFESIKVRSMELKNRVVMPPMQLTLGFRSQKARAFYTERARGGCGTIIMPATSVDLFTSDEVWGRPGRTAQFLEGCHLLTDDVHLAGAKVGVQLWHAKYLPSGISMSDTRGKPIAPSAVGDRQELTVEEIEEIIAKFAQAASACKGAGFDFVELHGAHAYLPCEFFSPLDNRRNDKYGGDLRRRMNFGLESVKAMRAAVGNDYPVFYRLGAWGDRPGDITPEDACEFAVELEKAGVDCLDISVALLTEPGISATPGPDQPMGTFVHLAEMVKRRVSVPVIAVGRINKLDVAEAILAEGKADLIAIGRQLIADPCWSQKMATGRQDEVRPCLSCNQCDGAFRGGGVFHCSVNPFAGNEAEWAITPAPVSKRVFVVGGGPAGMTAAHVAALRGHQVTLCEKASSLGGLLTIAEVPPNKKEIGELGRYLAREVERAGIQVRLGCDATSQMVIQENPDAVVIATGATQLTPEIPGVGGPNVVSAFDVLNGAPVGQKVVVLGGELVGCETADYLAGQGKQVTVTRRGDEMAVKMSERNRANLLNRLMEQGVTLMPGIKYEEITDKGLVVTTKGGQRTIEADTIVLAAGAVANKHLAEELKGKVGELHIIGDCLEPRMILESIAEGTRVGLEL
ncbi:FAD-dependent oxidoreductase [Chloroflexota bacterium]